MAVDNAEPQLVTQIGDLVVNPDDAVPSVAERSLLQKVIRKGLVENKNDLEIQRKDPKSPREYYSIIRFFLTKTYFVMHFQFIVSSRLKL